MLENLVKSGNTNGKNSWTFFSICSCSMTFYDLFIFQVFQSLWEPFIFSPFNFFFTKRLLQVTPDLHEKLLILIKLLGKMFFKLKV